MNNIKKINFFNSITISIFIIVFLAYFSFVFISKNLYFLFLVLIPFVFTLAVILRIFIKKGEIAPEIIGAIAAIAAGLNNSLNGFSANATNLAIVLNSEDFTEEAIKKYYPCVAPGITFSAFLTIPLFNFILFALTDGLINTNLYSNSFIKVTIISFILYFISIITSFFALYYEYGKEHVYKNLKAILIVLGALSVIVLFSIIVNL